LNKTYFALNSAIADFFVQFHSFSVVVVKVWGLAVAAVTVKARGIGGAVLVVVVRVVTAKISS
jgi:hypothetical protein